jgi:hypothetical protein
MTSKARSLYDSFLLRFEGGPGVAESQRLPIPQRTNQQLLGDSSELAQNRQLMAIMEQCKGMTSQQTDAVLSNLMEGGEKRAGV